MSNADDITYSRTEQREMLEAFFTLLGEPSTVAFLAILEPYFGRARAIPLSALLAMHRTRAPFGTLARACDVLLSMSAPGGMMADAGQHREMLELRLVLRSIERIGEINAAGGAA